jgi:succinate-acetate transporter protein
MRVADDIKLSNPAVLGLTCFGLTTMLLNLHNVGLIKGFDTTILGLGFFVGGLAQVIAGVMEFRKGNTFASTAFLAYGTFWISLVFAVLAGEAWKLSFVAKQGLAWYLVLWGIFTFFMTIATFRINRVLQFVFITLTVLFIMLAIGFFQGVEAGHGILLAAGVVGLFTGFAALYLAMAENINEIYGRTVLPIWPYSEPEAYKHPEDL